MVFRRWLFGFFRFSLWDAIYVRFDFRAFAKLGNPTVHEFLPLLAFRFSDDTLTNIFLLKRFLVFIASFVFSEHHVVFLPLNVNFNDTLVCLTDLCIKRRVQEGFSSRRECIPANIVRVPGRGGIRTGTDEFTTIRKFLSDFKDVFAFFDLRVNFIRPLFIEKRDTGKPHLLRTNILRFVLFVVLNIIVFTQREFVVYLLRCNFLNHQLVKIILNLLENFWVFVEFFVSGKIKN